MRLPKSSFTKVLLSTFCGATLALTLSACKDAVVNTTANNAEFNNTAANTVNKTNTVTNINAAADNQSITQSNTNSEKMTVSQATAQEKQEIFLLIKKDKDVSDYLKDSPKEAGKLSESLTVRKMDLNADNQPEYVAVIEDGVLCGAHANCPHWIYGKNGDNYNLLRRTNAQVIKLEKTSTKGFLDLRAEGSDTATTNSYVIFKFDGNKYQPDKCISRDESAKPAKETRADCKDFGEEIQ